jgi:hypothetical protein
VARANTTIFKVVNALLLKPLPHPIPIVSWGRRDKIILHGTKNGATSAHCGSM